MVSGLYTFASSALSFAALVACLPQATVTFTTTLSPSTEPSVSIPDIPLPSPTAQLQCFGGGFAECCEVVGSASSDLISQVLNGLGIVIPDFALTVGAGCTPIKGFDICSEKPVCCSSTIHNNTIGLGCASIDI